MGATLTKTYTKVDTSALSRQLPVPVAPHSSKFMSLHKEISFESEICDHLAANNWLYAEGDAAAYDRTRALYPADVLAWVQGTQPDAWDALVKNHGANAGETLLDRLHLRV